MKVTIEKLKPDDQFRFNKKGKIWTRLETTSNRSGLKILCSTVTKDDPNPAYRKLRLQWFPFWYDVEKINK